MYPLHPIPLPFVGAQKMYRKHRLIQQFLTVALLSNRCLCVCKLCAPVPAMARKCYWVLPTGSCSGFSGLESRIGCSAEG